MKLTIGMMVRNEEKWLEKCLASLEPLRRAVPSELIIVDTGSNDGTVEIARQFTKRVYSHQWNNDFAAMRNVVLGYAKGEWFFSIDADEVLENPEGIIRFLTSAASKKFRTAQVVIRNILRRSPVQTTATAVIPRLFRNEPGFRYVGSIHEQPLWRPPVIQLEATLVHYGYLNDDDDLMEQKFVRNESMLRAALEADPDNIYYWFQLYQTYAMHKDHQKALDAITQAYKLVKQSPLPRQKFMNVLISRVRAHYALGQYRSAIESAEEARDASGNYPDIYYYKALSHLAIGEKEEALEEFRSFLKLAANYRSHDAFKDASVPHHSLDSVDYVRQEFIRLCYETGRHEEVLQRAWEFENLDLLEPVLQQLVGSFFELVAYDRLQEFLRLLGSRADSRLRNKFLTALEHRRLSADASVDQQLSMMFSEDDTEYGLLNRVRLSQSTDELCAHLASVESWKWADLPAFYGEIVYLALRERRLALNSLTEVSDEHLRELLAFARRRRDDVPVVLAQWLSDEVAPTTIGELRVAKALAQYALLNHEWETEVFKSLFEKYVTWGVQYITRLYNPEVLDAELERELKTSEEVALLHIWKGSVGTIGPTERVAHLRKALDAFPALGRGIRVRLEELQAEVKESESARHSATTKERFGQLPESHVQGQAGESLDNGLTSRPSTVTQEFERHKERVKGNIRTLVTLGRIEEAESLLTEYAKLVPNDPEVYAIGSTIAAARSDWDAALGLAKQGLELQPDSFDLIFNLAYALRAKGSLSEALQACKQAEALARSPEEMQDVQALLNETQGQLTDTPIEELPAGSISIPASLGSAARGSVIIASPVRQTPGILRTFLESLLKLDVRGVDVEYVFVDDNEVPESTALLRDFAGRVAQQVTVWKPTTPSERYIKDDKTHRWTEGLMWRVARFKDEIIEFALGRGSSYLLLVDSDLVLHPLTLQQLVALGLPVVSEIFWTKWNPDGPEFPQVWVGGQYRLYRRAPGESISDEDVTRRTADFLAALRIPGVYQVGGLGALTLFSREALLRGVRFAPIPNLDLVGEDRHLCVRAAALGIPLHVDTHYPALHLYRQADLERVDEYTSTAQKEVKVIQMVENSVEALLTVGAEAPDLRHSRCSVQPAGILERIRREFRVDGPNGMSLSEVTVYNGLVQFVGHQRCTTYFHLRVTPRQGGPTYNFRGTAHFETDARKAWRLAELQLDESEPIQPVVLL